MSRQLPNVSSVSLHRFKLTHSVLSTRQNRRKTRETRNVCLPCRIGWSQWYNPQAVSVGHKGEGSPEATLPRRPTPTPALSLNSRCPGTLLLPVLCPKAPTLPLRELIRKAHCSPCAYPAPGTAASGKVTGRRTVTLSMAGNLGGGQSRLGCSGLEAHFCHQIC